MRFLPLQSNLILLQRTATLSFAHVHWSFATSDTIFLKPLETTYCTSLTVKRHQHPVSYVLPVRT